MSQVDLTSVLGPDLLELIIHIFDDKLCGVLDTEVWDQSDGEFALDGAWDDGF